jgi:NDP-sugar pyrophosphorylase family protein
MAEVQREYGAVLPCGGKGTRLEDITAGLPKSLCRVAGEELIRFSLEAMDPAFIKHLVLAVGYGAEIVKAWMDQQLVPQPVTFSEQVEGGVLYAISAGARHVRQDAFVACNTDEIRMNLRLDDAVACHESSGALATMVTTSSDHVYRHRVVEADENGWAVFTKLKPPEYLDRPKYVGRVNTGCLIIEQAALEYFDPQHSKDWSGIIDPLCDARQLGVYHQENIHFFNVGTVEEYAEAAAFLEQNS